jgi:hypothetical protein
LGGGAERPARPEQRPNWSERSENRNDQWQQRVDNRHEAWNDRSERRQESRNDFQENREDRWDELESAREDRQDWRDQNREDWQDHREDMWEYRGDRAEEIWDDVGDIYDDVFDDHWWGSCGWGHGWAGHYPYNPWWWWSVAAWGTVAAFVDVVTPDPIYIDYGMTVVYEDDTVYVDNTPVPAAEYTEPLEEMAAVEQPPPPLPPPAEEEPAPDDTAPVADWMPLGVYALAQEEKGDPVAFFQISVNREGVLSGGYKSTLTDDQKPIAGKLDKKTQQAAWRIGDNTETIYATSLANLTLDVSPITIHFGETRTQTWLLVRMPEPAPAGEPQDIPEISKTPPPLASSK